VAEIRQVVPLTGHVTVGLFSTFISCDPFLEPVGTAGAALERRSVVQL